MTPEHIIQQLRAIFKRHADDQDGSGPCCAPCENLPVELLPIVQAEIERAVKPLREALEAFVEWDDYHGGIYSQHNPSVGRLIATARAALRPQTGAKEGDNE